MNTRQALHDSGWRLWLGTRGPLTRGLIGWAEQVIDQCARQGMHMAACAAELQITEAQSFTESWNDPLASIGANPGAP